MIALPEKKTRGYYGGISITDSTVTVNAGYCGLCAEYADIEISGDNAVVKVKGGDHAIGGGKAKTVVVQAEQPAPPPSSGGGGKATVALPFELKNNRTAANYSVFYVDDAGKLERLAAKYDTELGAFVFDIEHFSNYVVAYDENGGCAFCPQDATCVYARFADANTKAWYHDGVHFCVENGYMNGISDTKFAPSGTLSRAMIVTMLWRMAGEPVVNYAMSFTDVPAGKWYTEAIRWAQANKIVEGYSAASFGPGDPVTREQLAAILYRCAQFNGVDTNKFTENTNTLSHNDVFTIREWAKPGMHFCIAAGIVNGDNNGNLNPRNTATRAEAAAMLQRFCERILMKK